MSDQKTYAYVSGMVQAFTKDGVKQPAVRVGDANGQTVYNVKVKTNNQNIVDIAMWSGDWGDTPSKIGEGDIVFADGPVKQDTKNGTTYTQVTAYRLSVLRGVTKLEREVVNQPAAAAGQPTPEQIAAFMASQNQVGPVEQTAAASTPYSPYSF